MSNFAPLAFENMEANSANKDEAEQSATLTQPLYINDPPKVDRAVATALIERLDFVGQLPRDRIINVGGMFYEDPRAYLSSITRYWTGESREKTLAFLEGIIRDVEYAQEIGYETPELASSVSRFFDNFIDGLTRLRFSYPFDQRVNSAIVALQERARWAFRSETPYALPSPKEISAIEIPIFSPTLAHSTSSIHSTHEKSNLNVHQNTQTVLDTISTPAQKPEDSVVAQGQFVAPCKPSQVLEMAVQDFNIEAANKDKSIVKTNVTDFVQNTGIKPIGTPSTISSLWTPLDYSTNFPALNTGAFEPRRSTRRVSSIGDFGEQVAARARLFSTSSKLFSGAQDDTNELD